MLLRRRLLCSLLASALLCSQPALWAQAQGSDGPAFQKIVERYFRDYFRDNPSSATYAGIHDYDSQLEDYGKKAIEDDIRANQAYLAELGKLDPKKLSAADAADRELLISTLQASLLEATRIRSWEKNPDIYSSGLSASVFTLMSRNFAPPEVRLKAVIARQRQMPQVLVAGRANLKNPPKVFTEVAIDQLPGNIDFFAVDLPKAFASVKDQKLLQEFKTSNQAVIAALRDYEKWLKTDLLPRSQGEYRLGAELYRKKLLYDEMVDIPLEKLLEIGYADLRRNQEQFRQVGARLDPRRTPAEILDALNKDHPPPAKLLQSFRDVLGGLKSFIETKKIVTIPSTVLPLVEETPPFERALIFASMDTPGPFETKAKEAYFNVTLPEPDWSPQEIEEHMAGFNYGTIISTAIHEAYPGHYVQFLWVPKAKGIVRKMLGASSNFEGWAHYTEQMMLDEGYGQGDLKLRLGQLQDALLRNARYIVGIKLHTGQMSFEQGVDFFVKEGYQSRGNAERETLRGTSDPTYLYYTLGKLQIQKLREDYKRLKGKQFSLQEFHDRFLSQGFPPIKIIRKEMLGNDSPVL